MALDQVLNSYAKWIDHNLNDCDAPWKGTNKRNHLVCTITEKLRYLTLSFEKKKLNFSVETNTKMEELSVDQILSFR